MSWWVVSYEQAQNSVGSRLDPTPTNLVTETELVISASSSSAAVAAAKKKIGSNGINFVTQAGPFSSKAAAQKTADSKTKAQQKAAQAGKIPNPLAGLEGISHILGDFLGGVTDGKMWRSVGWLVLGMILLGGGAYMLAKGKDLIPNVVPIPV